MRIVAGKFRGRRLAEFPGEDIRPTPDRVKESLFQILSGRLPGARVLDLFAGSGALGLEALSRGAREAVFNDSSPSSRAVLNKNLHALGAEAEVLPLPFESCLRAVLPFFDLIFCDPPYREDYLKQVLSIVKERGLLSEGGLVVYESEREENADMGWKIFDRRSYGRTKIALFARSDE